MWNAQKIALLVVLAVVCISLAAAETAAPVTFTGGHETDPRDGGRPVVLIAAALEVKPEVFREAFSGVTPARDHKPSGEEARRNKAALMKVLQPLGVTNDRLDEVSNYYRYQLQRGELWKNKPAKAHAVLEGGRIAKIVIDEPGSGYSTAPQAVVQGMEKTRIKISIEFGKEFEKNGTVAKVEVSSAENAARP